MAESVENEAERLGTLLQGVLARWGQEDPDAAYRFAVKFQRALAETMIPALPTSWSGGAPSGEPKALPPRVVVGVCHLCDSDLVREVHGSFRCSNPNCNFVD